MRIFSLLTALAASAQPLLGPHSARLGSVSYRLPDNWVFAAACRDDDRACQARTADLAAKLKATPGPAIDLFGSRLRMQCSQEPCLAGYTPSDWDFEACLAAQACRTELEALLQGAQAAAAQDEGILRGARESSHFLTLGMTAEREPGPGPGLRASPTPVAPAKGAPGSSAPMSGETQSAAGQPGSAGLELLRDGWAGSPESGLEGVTESIVASSPFLAEHVRAYLASPASSTDLRSLRTLGADVIDPIRQQLGVEPSADGGGSNLDHAYDGKSTALPQLGRLRCGSAFFGAPSCPRQP